MKPTLMDVAAGVLLLLAGAGPSANDGRKIVAEGKPFECTP
ncbi:MAG TPA: hypothetical protein VI297_06085 [Gemmatimonadales bacterium]